MPRFTYVTSTFITEKLCLVAYEQLSESNGSYSASLVLFGWYAAGYMCS